MQLDLIDYKELDTFPSGSGIDFFDDKIYIVGDDAAVCLSPINDGKPFMR